MHRRARSGAWKVAYADFVTALMALFIVLWMMNASAAVKRSVAGYFRDPRGHARVSGAGPAGPGEGLPVNRQSAANMQQMIEQALRAMPGFDKLGDHVKLSVTGEGLRIDLLENEEGMFFVTGSAEPTATGQNLLNVLADPADPHAKLDCGGRPYRFVAVPQRQARTGLQQLGTLHRPRQCRASRALFRRLASRPHCGSARLCRSKTARTRHAREPAQSENFDRSAADE